MGLLHDELVEQGKRIFLGVLLFLLVLRITCTLLPIGQDRFFLYTHSHVQCLHALAPAVTSSSSKGLTVVVDIRGLLKGVAVNSVA